MVLFSSTSGELGLAQLIDKNVCNAGQIEIHQTKNNTTEGSSAPLTTNGDNYENSNEHIPKIHTDSTIY